MDPNETLRELREAMQTYLRGEATRDREVMADAAADLYTHAGALDKWLSRGGFLPDAWRAEVSEHYRKPAGWDGLMKDYGPGGKYDPEAPDHETADWWPKRTGE